jgi:hypothetical protein
MSKNSLYANCAHRNFVYLLALSKICIVYFIYHCRHGGIQDNQGKHSCTEWNSPFNR